MNVSNAMIFSEGWLDSILNKHLGAPHKPSEEGSDDYKLTRGLKPKGGLNPNPSPLLLKKRDNYNERESLEETKKNEKNSEIKTCNGPLDCPRLQA